MKKSLIALAVLAASGASFAQSSVTLYGIADVWLGRTTATGAASQIKLDSGGLSGSRFGLKGSEDLGGGLKANFLLESGFTIDDGAQAKAGVLFNRQAYVGFSGGFGEVKLGNVYTAYDDISASANAVFDSGLAPVTNVWKSTGYTSNPNNNIYYATPTYSGFSGAVSYGLGENKNNPVAGDAGEYYSAHAKYEAGPLFAGIAYQVEKASAAVSAAKFTRLNATYDLRVVKVLAGYGRKTVSATSAETNEWELGLDYPVSSALTLSGGIATSSDNANTTTPDASRKGYGLGAAYTLSKRTTVYGGYQSATQTLSGTDTDATTLAIGVRHTF